MIKKKNKKPHYWLNAVKHLQSNDPVLSKLINKHRSKTYLVTANSIFITFTNFFPNFFPNLFSIKKHKKNSPNHLKAYKSVQKPTKTNKNFKKTSPKHKAKKLKPKNKQNKKN